MIPRQFAYKISKKLEQAGYIEIIRGAQGGCRLVKDLHELNLMDVILVMDRDNMIISCLDGNFECLYRRRHGFCPTHDAYAAIQDKLAENLAAIPLHDLISAPKSDVIPAEKAE